MKIAHTVRLSVFAYEGEDSAKIASVMRSLLPFSLEKERLELKQTNATGFNERRIVVFELLLQKEKHTNAFLNSLKQRLSDDQKQLLLRQSESRLDSELSFFIRLDKDRLLNENRFWITDSGNCFHIRMSIAAYPSNREAALKVISQWLS
jgi:RNA binding exosome subunit